MARDAVAEVRERTDIVELVSAYVPLKRTGRSFKGLCPFHQEKTSSFVVFPDSQNFHCFGCGKGGDAFTFYMGVEHVEFREALQELARRAGVELASVPTVAPEVDAHRQKLLDLNAQAATFYANLLLNSEAGAPGRAVVAQRGLSREMIERFQLGYAMDRFDGLLRYFASRNVPTDLAVEAGLLSMRDDGKIYDRFRGRLMFPIRDREGRVVGFGGRIIGDGVPKYLNSPQSAIFDKSGLLYGLDLAKEEIRRRDQVVIVEGYMDGIAAHQFGHANVVAQMGTALTEAQVGLVKRLTKHIVLALDSDTAGQMATLRGLETMNEALDHDEVPVLDAGGVLRFERRLNADIAIAELPHGKDPDELIRRAPDEWPEVVANARPFLEFYIDSIAADIPARDALAKSAAVVRAAPVLRQVADRVVQAHYIRMLAQRLNVPEETVNSEIRKAGLHTSAKRPQTIVKRVQRVSHEDHLLALLLRHRSLCRDIIARVPVDDILDERNRQLLQFLADETIPDVEVEPLVAGLDDLLADHAERLLATLAATPADLPGRVQSEAQQTLELLSKERYAFLMRQLQNGIQEAQRSGDHTALQEMTAQLSQLSERHAQFYPRRSPYFRDSRDQRVS